VDKIEAVGTGLRRYAIEVHRRGEDALLVVFPLGKKKTVVKLLLRDGERRELIRALGGIAGIEIPGESGGTSYIYKK